jgi:CheY-like chemotaxis protein
MTSAEGTPDLILTDLSMPEEDGFSLLQRVRALPVPHASIPVLAVSALRAEEAERRAVSHGFAGYIQKPVDCDTLVGAIARVVFSARHDTSGQTTLGGSGRTLGPTII